MNLPTQSQITAIGRHAVSYAMGGITVLGVMHLVGANDVQTLTDSVNKISQGVALIVTGLGPIIAIASATWASISASPKSQIAAVNSIDNVKVVSSNIPAPIVTEPPKKP